MKKARPACAGANRRGKANGLARRKLRSAACIHIDVSMSALRFGLGAIRCPIAMAAIACLSSCESTPKGPCNASIAGGATFSVEVVSRLTYTPDDASCGDTFDLAPSKSFLIRAGEQYPVGNECYGRDGQISELEGVSFTGPATGAGEGHWFRMQATVRISDACEGTWLAFIDGGGEELPAEGTLDRRFVPESSPEACGLSSASCWDGFKVRVTRR